MELRTTTTTAWEGQQTARKGIKGKTELDGVKDNYNRLRGRKMGEREGEGGKKRREVGRKERTARAIRLEEKKEMRREEIVEKERVRRSKGKEIKN